MTRTSLEGVVRQYARAFDTDASLLVVAPERLGAAVTAGAFAGWCVTDCADTFHPITGSASPGGDDLVFESSGTTGDPKLVRYRKQVVRNCADAIARSLDLDAGRDYVALVNPRFAYGLSIIHSHVTASVPVRFEAAPTSLDAWARVRASLTPDAAVYLAPHHSFLLAQDPGWRFDEHVELVFAGGPLRQSMVDLLAMSFPNATVTNMYGQAELGPRIALRRSVIAEFREGDVGAPLPGVRVRVDAPATPDDPSPTRGEILVNSPYRMEGYVAMDGTAIAAEPAPEWWRTGDVGSVGPAGDVLITGRAAPDVNFLGTRINLDHLRRAVRGVAGVLDTRVSAVPHDAFGQCPHIRVLIPSLADRDSVERAVRIALSDTIGKAAAAALVDIVDPASLPESGKL